VTDHLVLARDLAVLCFQGGQSWSHRLLLVAHLGFQQTLILRRLGGHRTGRTHLSSIVRHDRGSRPLQSSCCELLLLLLQLGSGHGQLLLLRLVGGASLLLLLLGSECIELGSCLGGSLGHIALDDFCGEIN